MDTPRIREATGQLENVKSEIREGLTKGQFNLGELQQALLDKSKAAAATTDRLVHDNPWHSIGIAAAFGLVIGLLMPRR